MPKKSLNFTVLGFFLLIFVIAAVAVNFFPQSLKPAPSALIRDRIRCDSNKFSAGLLTSSIGQEDSLKLIISFRDKPDTAVISDYKSKGITLHPESWIFDYLIAEASYQRLCDLANDNRVTYIDIYTS